MAMLRVGVAELRRPALALLPMAMSFAFIAYEPPSAMELSP